MHLFHRTIAILAAAATAAVLAFSPAVGAEADVARGFVYHDINGDGIHDIDIEPCLPGVAVSNGRKVVRTDGNGAWSLPVDGDTILFVIKPRGWMTAGDDDNLPRFYYVHRPDGSPARNHPGVAPTGPLPESIDFPLYPHPEPDRFDALILGDTQPRDLGEIDWFGQEMIPELRGLDVEFAVSLGDLVFNDLSLMEPQNRMNALIGAPVYNVPGNHDTNHDAPDDAGSLETFHRVYGPSYYAFVYGRVHFLVMDDVCWTGDGYHAEIDPDQVAFLRNYLAGVDPDTALIVPLMHIPLQGLRNRDVLLGILGRFPHTFSLGAHWHSQRHIFLGPEHGWPRNEPHHHLVHGTACGSWWTGARDPLGIPHARMSDGVPNGYSVATFDGVEYSLRYKAARCPADYQMDIHLPHAVTADNTTGPEVVVNIFAGSDRSVVEMRVSGDDAWTPMEQVRQVAPFFAEMKKREHHLKKIVYDDLSKEARAKARLNAVPGFIDAVGRTLPGAAETTHLWAARLPPLPPGVHLVEVRTTDMFGNEHLACRPVRVTE